MSEAAETITISPVYVLLREPETVGWEARLEERIAGREILQRGRTQLSGNWYRWVRVEK
jgi:hypothetical protein